MVKRSVRMFWGSLIERVAPTMDAELSQLDVWDGVHPAA